MSINQKQMILKETDFDDFSIFLLQNNVAQHHWGNPQAENADLSLLLKNQ